MSIKRRLRAAWRRWRLSPKLGRTDFGALRRTSPISPVFGFDRGLPIDRYYIEDFLASHANDIAGRVLEIADSTYTDRFGGARVSKAEVLHVDANAPGATIVGDLAHLSHVPADSFDCIVLTQTLQFIYELEPAIGHVHRVLRPGGVVLCTLPGISQISRYDMDRWGDFWRFTTCSARRLFESAFEPGNVTVEARGNVLASVAFLHGLAVSELTESELDDRDDDYQLILTVRAIKETES